MHSAQCTVHSCRIAIAVINQRAVCSIVEQTALVHMMKKK